MYFIFCTIISVLIFISKFTSRIYLWFLNLYEKLYAIRFKQLEMLYVKNPNRINELMLENEILRKENIALSSANRINKNIINQLTNKHSCMCTRLSILSLKLTHGLSFREIEHLTAFSSRRISEWIRRFKKYGFPGIISRFQLPFSIKYTTRHEIAKQVWQMHDDNPNWGRWKITQSLWLCGIFIAPSTVRNILKRERPKLNYSRLPQKPRDDSPHNKTINGKRSDYLWSIDLCSIMVGAYQSYILAIIDHFSRKIIHTAFSLGQPSTEWVINNLRYAISEYNCPEHIITDHGGQFQGKKFKYFLHVYGINHRQGRIGIPYSNGKIERFFLSFQSEVLHYFPLLTEQKVRLLLKEYHLYYNTLRPHQALDGTVPDNVYYKNQLISGKPPKKNKEIKGSIDKKRFCCGVVNAYVLQ
jgi:transposase InsO family protein